MKAAVPLESGCDKFVPGRRAASTGCTLNTHRLVDGGIKP